MLVGRLVEPVVVITDDANDKPLIVESSDNIYTKCPLF